MSNESETIPASQALVASSDGLDRDRSNEIYISVRIESLRKTVPAIQGPALPEDIAARTEILEALKSHGYEVLATGEGKYADAWVKKPISNDAEMIAAQERLIAKRQSLGISV